jgi:hypothetical protein
MSTTAVPDRFTTLPDEHALPATVVALEEHGFSVGGSVTARLRQPQWTTATTIDPSPMAAAQRLTDPQRTSPAANTPGRLVSSGSGSLGSGQRPPGSLAPSLPVTRYPAVLAASPIPVAPSVRGMPPMQMNKASAGNRTGSVLSPERTMTARRRSSASRPTTCVRTRTSTFGIAVTWSMRYCDIDAPRSRPQTSNVTCRAYRKNRTTAWPAELPPPTTTRSWWS